MQPIGFASGFYFLWYWRERRV